MLQKIARKMITDAARRFLDGWATGELNKAYEVTTETYRAEEGVANFIKIFKPLALEGYVNEERFELERRGKNAARIQIQCRMNGAPYRVSFMLVREVAPYRPSLVGLWGINPASFRFDRQDGAG